MFRRHKKGNGDWVPEQTSRHFSEDPVVQMKIIRTHIAAQATEIGNLAQQQREVLTALARVEVLLREIAPA